MWCQGRLSAVGFAALGLLMQGCAQQSQMQTLAPGPGPGSTLTIQLETCLDRTANRTRDLAAEATRLVEEGLRATPGVELKAQAPLVLSCEVTQYVEGSAFKRWLMPGWGSTVGQVAVMLSRAADQSVVVIIQGNATVSAGGLYTVGAEDYILKSAVQDVIARLRAWASSAARAAAGA